MPQREVVIGIDTGGTFTDAVVLEYQSRKVLHAVKTLTTREDLLTGILRSLDALDIPQDALVRLVGVSSTLATNAIAEGATQKAGLVLIGYDEELVEGYDLQEQLGTDCYAYFKGGHDSQGNEASPLDIDGILDWVKAHRHEISGLAVSSYFSPLNADHEERVFEAVSEIADIPVVLGHELSTKLDSIKRASTSALNASLVPVMHSFVRAAQSALEQKGIEAPLMIVKGDGTLIPCGIAVQRPVETILSGPSASAIGGRFLSGEKRALMIDMGGTTTDMILCEENGLSLHEDGATVGSVKTAIRSPNIRTVCIGCDSAIAIDSDERITIGPNRIVPICRAAAQFPAIEEEVHGLNHRSAAILKPSDLEFWILRRVDVLEEETGMKDDIRDALLTLLSDAPKSLSAILSHLNIYHPVQLGAQRLFEKGAIEKASITPTDLLHASGIVTNWSESAAKNAIEAFCAIHNRKMGEFITDAIEQIKRRIAEEAIIYLAKFDDADNLPDAIEGEWGEWFFDRIFSETETPINVSVGTNLAVIGLGAPIHAFLPYITEKLLTRGVLPKHYEAANAVGAVSGSISIQKEAICYVRNRQGKCAYIIQLDDVNRNFTREEDALRYAEEHVIESAKKTALENGAQHPVVSLMKNEESGILRIIAVAVGNPDPNKLEQTRQASAKS